MSKKKLLVRSIIILLELLVIFNIFSSFTKPRTAYSLSVDDMRSRGAIQVDLSGNGWYIDSSIELEESVFLRTNTVELPKGSYIITIHYQIADKGTLVSFDSETPSYRLIAGRQNMRLEENISKKEYELYLTEDEDTFYIDFKFEGYGYAWISGVDIMQTWGMERVQALYCILLILLVEALWLCYSKKVLSKIVSSSNGCKTILTVLLISIPVVLSSLPCLYYYIIDGFDLNFHMLRIEGIAEALKSGNMPARIQTNWLNGYGYPTSVFYGDLLLYIPAILRMIGMPLQDTYKFLVIFVNILTGFFMYLAAKNITKSRSMGVLASYLYLLLPYRLSCIYVRAGVGEYCAMVFFPLIVWGIIEIYTCDMTSKKWKYVWILPSIGYFGVISSHLISTVLVGLVTIFCCLILLKRTFVKERFVALVKVVVAAIAMSAAYIVPLLDYMRSDFKINDTMKKDAIQTNGAFISQIFSLFPGGNDYSVSIAEHLGYKNEMVFSLGIVIWLGIFLLGIYCIFVLRDKEGLLVKREYSREKGIIYILLGIGILTMLMSTDFFPWDSISDALGNWRFLATKIQFPWRYLSVSSVLLILGSVVVIHSSLIKIDLLENMKFEKHYYSLGYVAIIGFSIISAGFFISQTITENNSVYIIANCDLDDSRLQGAEYVPAGIDINSLIAREEPESYNAVLTNAESSKRGYLVFVEEAQIDNLISIPKIYYKGYEAKLMKSSEWIKCSSDNIGRVCFQVPEGYEGDVFVAFREPWYWRGAEFISVVSVIGLAIYMGKNSRYNKVKGYVS